MISLIQQHISSKLQAVAHYYPNLNDRFKDRWITHPFIVEVTIIDDADLSAKIEYITLRV